MFSFASADDCVRVRQCNPQNPGRGAGSPVSTEFHFSSLLLSSSGSSQLPGEKGMFTPVLNAKLFVK